MKTMKKFIKGWGSLLLLPILFGLILGIALFEGSGIASAELSKAARFSIGEAYSTALGNATGTTTAVKVTENKTNNESPAAINCFFAMTAPSGSAALANTATVILETSADGVLFDQFKSVSVAASVVTGIYQTPTAVLPMGSYWRFNVTAIQNALGDAYVTGKCFIQ